MSQAFKNALSTTDGRRMLLEAKAFTHTLEKDYALGAQYLLNWMEVKATAEERAKGREPAKPARGRVKDA